MTLQYEKDARIIKLFFNTFAKFGCVFFHGFNFSYKYY